MQKAISNSLVATLEAKALEIINENNGITSIVIATPDGFEIASASRGNDDPKKIAAMASSISAISEAAIIEAGLCSEGTITIQTKNGFLILKEACCGSRKLIINLIGNENAVFAIANYWTSRLSEFVSDIAIPLEV